jgi:hypothetical protein
VVAFLVYLLCKRALPFLFNKLLFIKKERKKKKRINSSLMMFSSVWLMSWISMFSFVIVIGIESVKLLKTKGRLTLF